MQRPNLQFKMFFLLVIPALVIVAILPCRIFGSELKDKFSAEEITHESRLKSFRSTGKIFISGKTGIIETAYKRPGMIWSALRLDDFEIIQAFDGEVAWMRDQNGQAIELTGSDKKQLVSSAWLFGKSFLFDNRLQGETKYLKDTLINGEEYNLYAALPGGGDSLWVCFNPQAKRIEITREKLDEINLVTYMSDFRMVDGYETPFFNDTRSDIPQLNSTIEITEFEVNPPLSGSLFEFPDESDADYYFPDVADSVVIPMVYHRGHISLEVSIDGRPKIYFVLDSGAGINILDRQYAESLNIDFSGDFPTRGMSGYESAAITRIDSISIGEVRLLRQLVAIVDLSGLRLESEAGKIAGLLGYDLLSRFPARIDYVGQKLILYNSERFIPPDSEYGVEFDFSSKVPVIAGDIAGVGGKFLVDLGNSMGLILHKSFVDQHDLAESFTDIKEMTGNLSGVGGASNAYAAAADSFNFGPVHLEKTPILVAESEGGIIQSAEVDGNIGNMILQNFSVILDYPKQKIYIMPLN